MGFGGATSPMVALAKFQGTNDSQGRIGPTRPYQSGEKWDRVQRMEVLTALIADSASDYQGKLCVLGSFDTICARQYPAVHPHCSIALRLLFRTGDEGKHTIQISFIDSDGKAILPEGGPRIEFTMGEPPAQAFFWSQNFIFNIAGLRLPSPGQYSLDVLYDGKIVSRIPLQGVQIQQPAQPG